MVIQRGKPTDKLYDHRAAEDAADAALAAQIEDTRKRRFAKAMALKDEIGLTPDERHSLAQMIPGVDKDDGGSWKDLNPKQLNILLDYMTGYQYIQALKMQRPPTEVSGAGYTTTSTMGTLRYGDGSTFTHTWKGMHGEQGQGQGNQF